MDSDKAAISVFGLGYVGCVSAACFAARGHSVIGVDANPQTTQFIRDGVAPIVEDRIAELTKHVVSDGLLTVADDPITAVLESDISLISVGAPSTSGGGLSTEAIERASAQIGAALAVEDGWHVIALRSTMVPGMFSSPRSNVRRASESVSTSASVVDAVAQVGQEKTVVDLVRLPDASTRRQRPHYVGIGW